MGAFCGKASDDETAPAAQQQQQQQKQPQQQQQQHAGISPPAEGSAAAAQQNQQQQQLHHAPSASSGGLDEKDVQVQLGAAEPEFHAADAGQQAAGDEAYSFWDRNKVCKEEKCAQSGSVWNRASLSVIVSFLILFTSFYLFSFFSFSFPLRSLSPSLPFSPAQTFKPERQLPQGRQHTMQATMKATLGGGELQNTVKLPEGEDVRQQHKEEREMKDTRSERMGEGIWIGGRAPSRKG